MDQTRPDLSKAEPAVLAYIEALKLRSSACTSAVHDREK
jgi:hypothetical protein